MNQAERPSVTVILALLNGEAYLEQSLESLRAQTLQAHEVLIIDGGSSDRGLEIAAQFPFVRVLRQSGKGIPDANNQGIREARGDLVAFLEHDDLWDSRKLELQVQCFQANPSTDYCVTRFEFFRQPGSEIPSCFKPELFERSHLGRIMSCLMARKSLFDRIGFFDSSYVSAGDVEWFSRAQDSGAKLTIVEQVLMQKRIHGSNFSNLALGNNAEMLRALRQSVRRRGQNQKIGNLDIA